MSLRKIILILLAVIVGGGLLAWAFAPHPLPVDLATIARGTLTVTVDEDGTTAIRDVYQVTAPISGDVQRIGFKVGDPVTSGMVVARIAPQLSTPLDARSRGEAEAAVSAARANIDQAESALAGALAQQDYAKAEVDRVMTLMQRGTATRSAADQAQLALKQADTSVASARAALEINRSALAQAEVRLMEPGGDGRPAPLFDVRSPVDGEVLAIHNDGSTTLAAGTPLISVGNPRDLEIKVELLSADAVRLKLGAPATITRWGGPPESWRALGHLYRVFVATEVERVDDAVLVPTAALFRTGSDWTAYAIDAEGVVALRTLTLGPRTARFAVVTDGLTEGDRVILHPNDQIAAGTKVIDREAAQ